MTWFGWLFLAFLTLNVVVVAYTTGRPRKQLGPDDLFWAVVVNALIFWGAYTVGIAS